jgi:uncharacterized protein
MATILITGGTGMIGSAITKALTNKGYDVIIVSRDKKDAEPGKKIFYALWDTAKGTIDEEAVKKADAIIHLAGANVAGGRWTQKRKKEIRESRIKSGDLLVKALKQIPNKIKTVISVSAIGWYGPDKEIPNANPFTETDPADASFLGQTCQQWEAAIMPVTELGKRLVVYRLGIVLSNDGGAYNEFKKPLNFGVASILGTGRQIVSWIHIDDVVQLFITALENSGLQGIFNAVAPNPVSNKQLILSMAKAKDGFFITASVPEFVLKTMLGEMSLEVLKSATVSSAKIEKEGYNFIFSNIDTATYNLNKKASG